MVTPPPLASNRLKIGLFFTFLRDRVAPEKQQSYCLPVDLYPGQKHIRTVLKMKYFFKVPDNVFECGLKKHELLVYFYLAKCSNRDNTAFPSYQTIADKCNMTKKSAIEAVKVLEKIKLLGKTTRRNDAAEGCCLNLSNVYTVEKDISADAVLLNRYNEQIANLKTTYTGPESKKTFEEMDEKTARVIGWAQAGDPDVMRYLHPDPHLGKKKGKWFPGMKTFKPTERQAREAEPYVPQVVGEWAGDGNVEALIAPFYLPKG